MSEKQFKTKQGQKGGFLIMLIGPLGASLLGNLLTSIGTIRAGAGTTWAGKDFYCQLSFKFFWNTKLLSKWK